MTIPFLQAKLVTTICLWIVTILSTYLPWVIKKHFRQSISIMSFCNCLAGGVVFGAMLLHVFPSLFQEGTGTNYPLGTLFAGISFLVLLAIDRLFLSHSSCHAQNQSGHHAVHLKTASAPGAATTDTQLLNATLSDEQVINISSLAPTEELQPQLPYHHLIHRDNSVWPPSTPVSQHSAESYRDLPMRGSPVALTPISPSSPSPLEPFTSEKSLSAGDSIELTDKNGDSFEKLDAKSLLEKDKLIASPLPQGAPASTATKTQAFIFVIALSLHSFLEGLGLSGIDKDKELISYIIGLSSHKWLEAFALGMTVFNANFSRKVTFALNMFYASLTPIGILFGLLIVNSNVVGIHHTAVVVIFSGLSVGSFLFVCCIEMIPPEFAVINRQSPYKFLFVVLGFGIMAALAVLEDS